MDIQTKNRVLEQARLLIGTSYDEMDCSHFVQIAFSRAGLSYHYMNTESFDSPSNTSFKFVGINLQPRQLESADVVVFNSHMGIWDPNGCNVLGGNEQCEKLKNNAPFLSSRTTNNLGPNYGKLSWWHGNFKVFRWDKV